MRALTRCLLSLSVGLITIGCPPPAQPAPAPGSSPERIPWTTSRVLGNPEPPPPYTAQRVFPKLRFKEPTELAFIPGSDYAIVLTRPGEIFVFDATSDPAEAVLMGDLNEALERGAAAYGIAFHPGFATNRQVFISHTGRGEGGQTMRVTRFELHHGSPPRLDLSQPRRIIEWPSTGHTGGSLLFGRDGYFYISTGDGGAPAPPDPRRTGQTLDDLLSSILRLDVDHVDGDRPYRVPGGNPFVHRVGARPEIWAYGFRNPWKMCLDPRDGALWVGDVGWESWELVFRVDRGGFNAGWSIMEGPQRVNTSWTPGPTPIQPPVKAHFHSEAVSVTGGLVYRGARLPALRDAYVYGDWGTGRMWALRWSEGTVQILEEIAVTPHRIICFAANERSELFYMDYSGGGIYVLAPGPAKTSESVFPRKLSETGLFTSVSGLKYAPGVYPYEIAAPMWEDYATAEFAVALPNREKLAVIREGFAVPTNAVFVRTASMEMRKSDPASLRRIETQLLHFDGVNFNGYSYRWREDESDAELVEARGDILELVIADQDAPEGRREQKWRFHARSECSRCHLSRFDSRFGNLIGLVPEQLAGKNVPGDSTQLERFKRLELIEPSARVRNTWIPVDPLDSSQNLDSRARSWLHANCAHCHRDGGTGAVVMYLDGARPLEATKTVNTPAERGAFDLVSSHRIHAGDPYDSTLLFRIMTTGVGRMPMIGSSMPDDAGIRLIRDWIRTLGPDTSPRPEGASMKEPRPSLLTTGGAMELSLKLAHSELPESERKAIVNLAQASTNWLTRDLFERFLPWDQRRRLLGLEVDPSTVLSRTGSADRGRALFFGVAGPQCHTCHRVAGQGRDTGPDLSRIGSKYDRTALLHHILNPNEAIDPAWVAHTIETNEGDTVSGFVVARSDQELRIRIADGSVALLPAELIRSERPLAFSMMPEGLLQGLTALEAADLLAFLASCR